MILKYAIANVNPSTLANAAQKSGLSGSVYQGYGFGKWGVEPTVFVEFATDNTHDVDAFITQVLFRNREESAYRTVDNASPSLLHVSGLLEAIA